MPNGLRIEHLCDTKPDFHSRFSLVASENFRMRHAQSGETNRTDAKMSFALFAFEVEIFQLLRNFLTAKPIMQTSFLSHVDVTRGSKFFYEMAAPQLYEA